MLEKFSKKLHSEKGLTGADVAISIAVLVLTIAVVSAIYVNATNKYKETIRYSAATRIATQIIENIQSMTYDEVIYKCDNYYNSIDSDTDGTIFEVSVPTGYSAEITTSEVDGAEFDIIRDITVNVTYTISNVERAITLYTIKEKELLEQTNEPNLNLIDGYDSSSYYAIKYTGSSYIVTATSDSNWYNYDNGYYALIYYSAETLEYGDTLSAGEVETGDVYIWVPRFGLNSNSELAYCYGTSSYEITFAEYGESSILYSYMLTGSGNGENYTVDSISSYVSDTFKVNDGLSGVWYQPNDTNDSVAETAYDTLNSYISISNF